MRLKFEGQAIIDATGSIRFAGQYDEGGHPRIVICRVDREALIARCHLMEPTPEQLLAAYRSISEEINRLASAQFDGGIPKPVVTRADLEKT